MGGAIPVRVEPGDRAVSRRLPMLQVMEQRIACRRVWELSLVEDGIKGGVRPPPLLPSKVKIVLRAVYAGRRDVRIDAAIPSQIHRRMGVRYGAVRL